MYKSVVQILGLERWGDQTVDVGVVIGFGEEEIPVFCRLTKKYEGTHMYRGLVPFLPWPPDRTQIPLQRGFEGSFVRVVTGLTPLYESELVTTFVIPMVVRTKNSNLTNKFDVMTSPFLILSKSVIGATSTLSPLIYRRKRKGKEVKTSWCHLYFPITVISLH